MSNLDQVIAQIRFQLEQLSARNAHHEFEHLCRHLTRARICSNILPATGPVSAGGDQGRDFETFWTYLGSSSIASSTFVGLVSEKPIAFACSLETKKRISGKIRSDVGTIMSSGSTVEAVHYFCAADVTVAARHRLKAWSRKTYSLDLEIHDGQSIAELLSGRDVFWIAERYLNIPGEIYPRSPVDDGGEWYQEAMKRWKGEEPDLSNHAHFSNIRVAARQALNSEELKQDMPFWIRQIEKYVQSRSEQLKYRAIYEVAILSLKALGTFSGCEERLREYFVRIPGLENPSSLEDTAILLNYSINSVLLNQGGLTAEETSSWLQALTGKVERRLEGSISPNDQSLLLYLRGYLCLSADPLASQPPDTRGAVEWWLKCAEIIKDAPMFPLEKFADRLTQIMEIAEVPQSFFELTEKVDALLSKRLGGFAAAEKSLDRAEVLYKRGKTLAAIELLHRSKVNWFAHETLREALRTMLFISQCYLELGLVFAAKYYALAVAFIAVHNSRPAAKSFISRGLLQAALCDYMQGAACGFLNITAVSLFTHLRYAKDAGNLETSQELQSMVFHLITLKAIAERIAPQFERILDRKLTEWDFPKEWRKELLPTARESWETMSDAEIGRYLASQMYGAPYNDLGPTREVAWSELGVTWMVSWSNDYETIKIAEQFIATLQILLAETAKVDLCLLRTEVNIAFQVGDVNELEIAPLPSNKGRFWRVVLPIRNKKGRQLDTLHSETFTAASTVLFEISLLPEELYWREMEVLYHKGLSSNIFVAQSYETLYRDFISKKEFDSLERVSQNSVITSPASEIRQHEQLSWKSGPGPGYSRETVEEILRNRYRRLPSPIRFTLEWLKTNSGVMKTINQLREKGWLDWHILTAIASATTNYRFNQRRETLEDMRAVERFFEEANTEQPDWEPVPFSEFTERELTAQLHISMMATLQLFGLECHQKTPDIEAIDHFLRVRYNYWSDDIGHEDMLLAGDDTEGILKIS